MSIKKKVKNYNVLIEEGLRTRQMYPTDILKVDNTDSTDSLWMPQDNANYGTLYASENGIYIAARDGYDAYSEVDVRVTFDDFSDLDIDNLDDTWDLDSLDDLVIDEDLDIDEFDDLFNDEDLWDDPFDKIDSSFNDRVKGIDPVSGNEYAVGLDENGYLDEYLLPTKIKIVKFPNKITYLHDEIIEYAGIVVMAFSEDDKVWKNSQYPNGVIPFEELIFPIQKADALEAENIKYAKSTLDTETIQQPIPFATKTFIIKAKDKNDINTRGDTSVILLKERGSWNTGNNNNIIATGTLKSEADPVSSVLFASSEKLLGEDIVENYEFGDGSPTDHNHLYLNSSRNDNDDNKWIFTYQDKTVYFEMHQFGWWYEGTFYMIPEAGPGTLTDNAKENDLWNDNVMNHISKVAWTIVYGDITGGAVLIPVQWKRPDGEILETTFFINVSFPNETLPDYDWNKIDPAINPHDIPETPEGEVNP